MSKAEKKTPRHRQEVLNDRQRADLESICRDTKGLSLHGNRGRINLHLPHELVVHITEQCDLSGLSVGSQVVRILEAYYYGD